MNPNYYLGVYKDAQHQDVEPFYSVAAKKVADALCEAFKKDYASSRPELKFTVQRLGRDETAQRALWDEAINTLSKERTRSHSIWQWECGELGLVAEFDPYDPPLTEPEEGLCAHLHDRATRLHTFIDPAVFEVVAPDPDGWPCIVTDSDDGKVADETLGVADGDRGAGVPQSSGGRGGEDSEPRNEEGFVEKPLDESSYVPFTDIYTKHNALGATEKQLRKHLKDNLNGVRQWRPRSNRRCVNLIDWLSYQEAVKGKSRAQDAEPTPEEIEERKDAIRSRKQRGQ